jgi:hypothetical protein
MKQTKGNTVNIFKRKRNKNITKKKEEEKLTVMKKKPYLKKKKECVLSSNFKPMSKQTKMQKLKRKNMFLLY